MVLRRLQIQTFFFIVALLGLKPRAIDWKCILVFASWKEVRVRVGKGGFCANLHLRWKLCPNVVFESLEFFPKQA